MFSRLVPSYYEESQTPNTSGGELCEYIAGMKEQMGELTGHK